MNNWTIPQIEINTRRLEQQNALRQYQQGLLLQQLALVALVLLVIALVLFCI